MKKAFLLGCNSGKLRHCASDAALLEAALRVRGYDEIVRYAVDAASAAWYFSTRRDDGEYVRDTQKGTATESDIAGRLRELLKSVAQSDTFVFYFAGHGRDEGKDTDLILYAGPDMDDEDYHLDAADVIKRIRKSCQYARNVVIFDCCEAGAARDKIGANEEFFRVLTATDREGAVRELSQQELQAFTPCGELTAAARTVAGAGFLTWHLHHALTALPGDVVDHNGCLGIEPLTAWLKGRADDYNKQYRAAGKSIEVPELYGKAVNVVLADGLTRHLGYYPPELVDELKNLLAVSGLSSEDLLLCSGLCVRRANLQHPACGSDICGLVDHFKQFEYLIGEALPLPLLSFAAMVARKLNNPPPFQDWLRRCGEYLRVRQVAAQDIDLSLGEPQAKTVVLPCLMVEAAPLADGYELTCTFRDEQGEQEQVATPRYEAKLSEIENLLGEALQHKKVQGAFTRFNAEQRHLDLFLPYTALSEDPERWNPRKTPLSIQFRLALRSQERIRGVGSEEHDFCRNWQKTWAQNPCLDQPPKMLCDAQADPKRRPLCADWINEHSYKLYLRHRNNKGNLLFALRTPPTRENLHEMLRAGVDRVLWPRGDLEACQDSLCEYLCENPLARLPEALRLVHDELWNDLRDGGEATGFGFALLWDDPDPQRRPGVADEDVNRFPLSFSPIGA